MFKSSNVIHSITALWECSLNAKLSLVKAARLHKSHDGCHQRGVDTACSSVMMSITRCTNVLFSPGQNWHQSFAFPTKQAWSLHAQLSGQEVTAYM